MAQNDSNQGGDDRVSREAHDRVVRERDELKATLAERDAVIADVGIRDRARAFFKSQGAQDPDWAAEFALPHLRDTELDQIPEVLGSERFKPLISQASPSNDDGGASDGSGESPAQDPGSGFAGGPNPGGQGTAPPPEKISPNSPQFKEAVRNNNRQQIEKWDQAGLIDWNPAVLAQESA